MSVLASVLFIIFKDLENEIEFIFHTFVGDTKLDSVENTLKSRTRIQNEMINWKNNLNSAIK